MTEHSEIGHPSMPQENNWRRSIVLNRLSKLEMGQIRLNDSLGSHIFGDNHADLATTIEVRDDDFYQSIVSGGAVGAAEAYMRGSWNCSDLVTLVRILVLNRSVLDNMESGLARLATPLRKIAHRLRRNSRSGSKQNIAAHYDLGNEFFGLWLDPEMMYSCAWYEHAETTLDEAAVAKLRRICTKLQLTPQDRVIEIGSGWGGFATYAAANYGCHVTTTTISEQQFEHTRSKVQAMGLQDRVTVLKQDYRDLSGNFDKLVSIEMIEAVGHEFLDTFLSKCSSLLKENGSMLLQAITIADQRYERAVKSVDFIQKYIFPGGFLPSVTAITQSATRATDLRLLHLEDIGLHYARTLRDWRQRFYAALPKIRQQAFPEEFLRMWEYYFCYCEGAFAERAISNVQLVVGKPQCQDDPMAAISAA